MSRKPKRAYLVPGRLQDIFALLQVLALDEHSHRSEAGLMNELQKEPQSESTWTRIATQHPEFFRVRPTGDNVVSLLARHVSRTDEGRPPLSASQVKELLNAALAIHDRELDQSRAWRVWLPLLGVLAGSLLTILAMLIRP